MCRSADLLLIEEGESCMQKFTIELEELEKLNVNVFVYYYSGSRRQPGISKESAQMSPATHCSRP